MSADRPESHAATLYRCPDCGWTGTDPKEIEHPSGEFPPKFQCPKCGETEVEPDGKPRS